MTRRVLILDTSILCCLLKIPGKEVAGTTSDPWNHDRVATLLRHEMEVQSTLVLPLASLIETGNHISQSSHSRVELAQELGKIINSSALGNTPWATFTDQADLWSASRLAKLAADWPSLAVGRLSIGDATIKDVAEYYSEAGFDVEIVTGDSALKAYEPSRKVAVPRRRR